MSPRALLLLLALSLGGNAWLVFSARSPSAPLLASRPADPAAPIPGQSVAALAKPVTAPTASSAVAAPADPDAPRGFTWKQPTTDEDFRQLAADLRAAGFPSRFIATFVRTLYLQEAARRSPLAELPYWQRRGAESSKETQDRYRTLFAKVAPLLGPDGRPSLMLDVIARNRQYGPCPTPRSMPSPPSSAITAI